MKFLVLGLTALLAMPVQAFVHGNDDRTIEALYSGPVAIKNAAKAVAAKVNFGRISTEDNKFYSVGLIKGPAEFGSGKYILTGRHSGKEKFLCEDEKFYKQLSYATCSGFLIAEDILVTQAHCLTHHYDRDTQTQSKSCEGSAWVFNIPSDANVDNSTKLKVSDQKGRDVYQVGGIYTEGKDIFTCAEVIDWKASSIEGDTTFYDQLKITSGNEYAVIRLNKKVPGIEPIKISETITNGMNLSVIGYGQTGSKKIASGGKVFDKGNYQHFLSNLDVYEGDSGGPIVNSKGEAVGMLTASEPETYGIGYVLKPREQCLRDIKVPEDGFKFVTENVTTVSNMTGSIPFIFNTKGIMYIPGVIETYVVDAIPNDGGKYYIKAPFGYRPDIYEQFHQAKVSSAPIRPRTYGIKVGQLKRFVTD